MIAAPHENFGRDKALTRKVKTKFRVRRWFGEPYVGKRMKMRHLNLLLRHLTLPASPRLLEVGSGDGVFCAWLARRWPDATVEGMELDPVETAACAEWAAESRQTRLSFRQGDVLTMTDKDAYDLILCLDVLEHVQEDRQAVAHMMDALKPGGWLIVNCPNVNYQRLDGSLHTVPPEEAHHVNPGHVRNGYAPEDMHALLESAGPGKVGVFPRHGRLTDLAHTIYRKMENPVPLRLLSLPLVDTIWAVDVMLPGAHRNTVFGMAQKRA